MRLLSLELIREPVHCSECKFSFTVNVNFPSFFFEPTPKFHWNSDLMQVQGMGTRPSVFSINKKEITQFLERFHCTGPEHCTILFSWSQIRSRSFVKIMSQIRSRSLYFSIFKNWASSYLFSSKNDLDRDLI